MFGPWQLPAGQRRVGAHQIEAVRTRLDVVELSSLPRCPRCGSPGRPWRSRCPHAARRSRAGGRRRSRPGPRAPGRAARCPGRDSSPQVRGAWAPTRSKPFGRLDVVELGASSHVSTVWQSRQVVANPAACVLPIVIRLVARDAVVLARGRREEQLVVRAVTAPRRSEVRGRRRGRSRSDAWTWLNSASSHVSTVWQSRQVVANPVPACCPS